MFKLRALPLAATIAIVLLTCVAAVGQHEGGGGVASDAATSGDTGRAGIRIRRAPARAPAARRPAAPVRRGLTAEQYNQQGDTLFSAEQYDDALEAYSKAVQLKPIGSAFYHIGWIYNEREEYEQAITALQQALRLTPKYAAAYYELGFAYRNLKKYDEALLAYAATITIDPTRTKAYYDMGWIYNERKLFAQAVAPLRQAITLQPDYAEAHSELGYAYRKLGRYQEAIGSFRQSIQAKPDYANPYFGLGDVYFYNTSQYAEAISAYGKALALQPNNATA